MTIQFERSDVIRKLRVIASTRFGDPIPNFLLAPGGWGDRLSELAAVAADLIEERASNEDSRSETHQRDD